MCGIVGYIGPRQAAGLLLEGLRRLEYRGYDSSGIAVVNGNGLKIMKAAGKLSVLEQELEERDAAAAPSASATPAGPPTARRPRPTPIRTPTRPAASPSSTTASSRTPTPSGRRSRRGATPSSPRPTPRCWRTWWASSIRATSRRRVAEALRDVDGAYGLAFISADEPGVLVAARKGSPLLVGRRGERMVRGLRRLAAAAAHPLGGLPRRRRDGGADPRRATGCGTSRPRASASR